MGRYEVGVKRRQTAGELAQQLSPVRVEDLDGQPWLVPPGCLLHTQIRRDQEAGYTEQYLDAAALRAPAGEVFSGASDDELMKVFDGNEWLLEHGWRQGQLLLLRERVRARG